MDATAIRDRLAELGYELPTPPTPVASYLPCKSRGGLLYVSGQIPTSGGQPVATGSVPDDVTPEDAAGCAVQCTLNALAVATAALAPGEAISGVVKLSCFVASAPGFGGQPTIANGASELLYEVFGDAGRHARAAVGCSALPLNVPVEIEFVFALGSA